MKEKYSFDIKNNTGQKSLSLLDREYNQFTQFFLNSSGLKKGMRVIELGVGSGEMSYYIAKKIGTTGSLFAIDNSDRQLNFAKENCPDELRNIIKWEQRDINTLAIKEEFDFVYSRFTLHHLHSPEAAIQKIYNMLKPKGIYMGAEGIVNCAFSFPYSKGWTSPKLDEKLFEGKKRNPNLGLFMIKLLEKYGFKCNQANIFQPILIDESSRDDLLQLYKDRKKHDLDNGELSEKEWMNNYDERKKCVNDKSITIAFYAGMFFSGIKEARKRQNN